ncbi:MFS transporter [Tumebacillus sp. DT12]|uniref:MFS transporter n=1 Tax=Tumebacillus lacus TaxID=2995335 RepID=A0ABT3X3Y3_9BACL|nr:MFS transporter [Tumebacillus lacus]MCX7570295.1 MFS transporter [Tumebacillus lacus]
MSRAVVLLCLSVFVLVLGTGIVAPLLAPLARDLGATGFWVAMLYSGFSLVRLILGNPVGRLSDRKGPKMMLTISLLFYPFIALTYITAEHFAQLLGARLLHGVASAMMLPMAMAYMGQVSPRGEEGRYMGIYNTVFNIGSGLGPLVGGLVAQVYGVLAAFWSLMGLAFVAITIVFFLPKVEPVGDRRTRGDGGRPLSTWDLFRHPGLLAVAGIFVVLAVLEIYFISFFPLFAQERGISTFATGFLIALNYVAIGVMQVPFGRLADRVDRSKLITGAAFFTAAALLLFPLAQGVWAIAGMMLLVGVGTALTLSASAALSAVLGRSIGMGSTMGFLGTANSLGMILGPLANGACVDYFTVEATFYFSGVVWLLGAVLFLSLWAAYRRQATPDAGIGNISPGK